jgi:Sec-independent protein translocase protein TatA
MIAGILNFAGPDVVIILLIVFLLFGARQLATPATSGTLRN